MIIKGGPILSKNGHADTADHIFNGPKNERITALQGNPFIMQDMVFDAQNAGFKYGFHHFKISPDKEISRDEARKDFEEIAQEYGFNLDDAVIVEHQKPRSKKDNSAIHWHLIAPHYNRNTRRALDCRNSYKRNEKLSRLSEIRTGQTIIQGRHNKAVFFALQKEGKTAEAQTIQHLAEGELPSASFSVSQQRKAERKGINLPQEKATIENIWKASDGLKAFVSGLESEGFTLKVGTKKDTYIIEKNGTLIGSANRLLKMKKGDFATQYEKEINNVRIHEEKNTRPAKKAGLIKRASAKATDDYKDEFTEDTEAFTTADRSPETAHRDTAENTGRSDFSTQRNSPDSRTDSGNGRRTESNRADIGITSADTKEPRTTDTRNQRNAKNAISIAKINGLKPIELHDISHVRIVDDNYIDEIKTRLKQIKADDAEYFDGVYKNLKAQNREVYKYNKSIDNDAISLIIDAICRLLFGYTIKQQKAQPLPVSYPRIETPVDKATFDTMRPRDQRSIIFNALVQFRASYRRHANFHKKFNLPQEFSDFQAFLSHYSSDFMAEEMANIFPGFYIKELEKSEREEDRLIAHELRKIEKGEASEYSHHEATDLKSCIESIHGEISERMRLETESKKLDEVLRQQFAEWNEMQEQRRPQEKSNIIQFKR
ncbi:relaxase/mobilization nuclease domain-containing protein [Brytella acorum]|uniref:MobA/VirD2-like nuclease domain-containing protein n=1 Tax=Brytella acorum TaxID=2959299 RepID=A0AA35UYW5_9PROT|nr:hypothetical protein [Brytella acorum]MDF3626146.1 hypothetical protein [Brytella acorum]CAI9122020.1 hypothetical protein LMG32879_002876 [Brytella acorum]